MADELTTEDAATTRARELANVRRYRRGNWRRRAWRTFVAFTVLVIVWELSARASGASSFFYPRPTDVARAFDDLIRKGILFPYLSASMWRWAVGTFAGLIGAIIAVLVMTTSRVARQAFMPVVSFFHAIADLAWLPLFVLWFGFSFQTIVFTISYVVFFPVLYNALIGMRAVPMAAVNAVRTLGASRTQVMRHVMLPGALPSMLTGLRVGAGYAFRALIGAEMIAAKSGIGFMIFEAREYQITERVVAGMIVMGVLWLFIEYGYLRPVEQATIERWGLLQRAGDAP
jgi:NitT/TauT family transport system permease protein/taurine transport system permease protein